MMGRAPLEAARLLLEDLGLGPEQLTPQVGYGRVGWAVPGGLCACGRVGAGWKGSTRRAEAADAARGKVPCGLRAGRRVRAGVPVSTRLLL